MPGSASAIATGAENCKQQRTSTYSQPSSLLHAVADVLNIPGVKTIKYLPDSSVMLYLLPKKHAIQYDNTRDRGLNTVHNMAS